MFSPSFPLCRIVVALLCFSAGNILASSDGAGELYQVWIGDNHSIHRSGELGEELAWTIVADGEVALVRNAENELSFTYPQNKSGSEYLVYLQRWNGSYQERVSNIVGYRFGSESTAPIITSKRAVVGLLEQPFDYQITATGEENTFHATELPPGPQVTATGLITGLPKETGTFLVSLQAGKNGESGTAILVLTIVTGGNDGGLTDLFTLVLDSNYYVTWNLRDDVDELKIIIKVNGNAVPARNVLGENRHRYHLAKPGTTYSIHLESGGERVSNIVTYVPVRPPAAPIITSVSTIDGVIGWPLRVHQVTATDGPVTFEAQGLPPGTSITSSGIVSGIPSEVGIFSVQLVATNSVGSTIKEFTVAISDGSRHHFALRMDPDGTIHRSGGSMSNLTWVVVENGNIVMEAAANKLSFRYFRHEYVSDYTVYLTSWLNARATRVSNVEGPGAAVFKYMNLNKRLLRLGAPMLPLHIETTHADIILNASNLPPGIYISGQMLFGSPSATGTFDVQLHATNEAGESVAGVLSLMVADDPPDRSSIDFYLIAVDEDFTILKTAGDDVDLTWIVTEEGGRREASISVGDNFTYYRNHVQGKFAVYLAATIMGEQRRVSNIVGYSFPEGKRDPVFLPPFRLNLWRDRPISLQLKASAADMYQASGLPEGLSLSANGILSGIPLEEGAFDVSLQASGGGKVGFSRLPLLILPAEALSSYDRRYHVRVMDSVYQLLRTPGSDPQLAWVVKRDGVRLIGVSADGLAYSYFRNFEPGIYSVHLEAMVDGEMRVVSNTAQYTVGLTDRHQLLAHALRDPADNSGSSFTTVEKVYMTDGPAVAITYWFNLADTSLRTIVQQSTDLETWAEGEVIREVISGDVNSELRTDYLRIEAGPRQFYRLQVLQEEF